MSLNPTQKSPRALLGAIFLTGVIAIAVQIPLYLQQKEAVRSRHEQLRRLYNGEPERITPQLQKTLRRWPARVTVTDEGVEAYLGSSPMGSEKEKQMDMAAPFILCSLIKRYPKGSLMVKWDAYDSTSMNNRLTYDRDRDSLSETGYGGGGTHGLIFKSVTDKLLLQLEKEATQDQSSTINLYRLEKLGCRLRRI